MHVYLISNFIPGENATSAEAHLYLEVTYLCTLNRGE